VALVLGFACCSSYAPGSSSSRRTRGNNNNKTPQMMTAMPLSFGEVWRSVSESNVIGVGTVLAVAVASLKEAVPQQRRRRIDKARLKRLGARELREFDGVRSSKIYVGADGFVFDVTKSRDLYGPGGTYAAFAGKDASRMLAKGVVTPDEDDGPLSLPQRAALKAWVAALRSKYDVVAVLETRLDLELVEAAAGASSLSEVTRLTALGADVRSVDVAGDGAIHLAARAGNLDVLRHLLDIDATLVQARGSKHRTPLHFAADSKRSAELFKYLLALEGDPNALAADEWTVLHAAAQAGNVPQLENLLACPAYDRGVDPTTTAGVTPLLAAATFGHLQACETLLRHGADPHRPGPRGKTPADWALLKGHHQVCDLLLEWEAQGAGKTTTSALQGVVDTDQAP